MPEAVVGRTLVRIYQNSVGFGDFLEFLFRVRIVRVAVGMVLHRQLAIGALDLELPALPFDAQNFVVVSLHVTGQNSFPLLSAEPLLDTISWNFARLSPWRAEAAALSACSRAAVPRSHGGPERLKSPPSQSLRARADQIPGPWPVPDAHPVS